MNDLTIIVADDTPERFRTALVLAATQSAFGGRVEMFLQGAAVKLVRTPITDPEANTQQAAGLPSLAELFEEAIGLGVTVGACQSSLALLKADIGDFDSRIAWGGMVSLLGTRRPGDRLIVI